MNWEDEKERDRQTERVQRTHHHMKRGGLKRRGYEGEIARERESERERTRER